MRTRRCARCQREKSIRGVWYLLPGEGPFVCEACFLHPPAEALSGVPG